MDTISIINGLDPYQMANKEWSAKGELLNTSMYVAVEGEKQRIKRKLYLSLSLISRMKILKYFHHTGILWKVMFGRLTAAI